MRSPYCSARPSTWLWMSCQSPWRSAVSRRMLMMFVGLRRSASKASRISPRVWRLVTQAEATTATTARGSVTARSRVCRLKRRRCAGGVAPPSAGIDLGHLVADAVHGEQVGGRPRVGLQLLAQVQDVDVDRPLEPLVVEAERLLQQLRAGEGAAGRAGQCLEDGELLRGDLHGLTGEADLVANRVDVEVADAVPLRFDR